MKKKKSAGEAGWATAHFHFVLGHDTTNCIVTQAHRGVHGQARHGQQRVTTRPRYDQEALRHDRLARGASGSARAHGLAAGGESRYKFCFMAKGRPCVATQRATRLGYDTQHPAICRRSAVIRASGTGSRYNFCIVTGGKPFGSQYSEQQRCDTARARVIQRVRV